MFPFLKTVIGDAGYQGPKFRAGVAEAMTQLKIEIVKRSDMAEGFQLLPKRWIVERTLRAMCGRPLGCKRKNEKSDARVDCDHVSGLLTRRHDRWPRWGSRSSPKQ